MKLKNICIICSLLLISACSAPKNFILLSPAKDGSVGALEVKTDKGKQLLTEEGKAIYLTGNDNPPSLPTPIDATQAQTIFQEALRVHPLMPESFLLYFHANSNELTEESKKLIATIVESIKARQSSDVSVIGHTDRTGSDEYNKKLSLERAQVVRNLLREAQVRDEDMTIIYHGEGNPLIPTADNIAEPRNRRVEVMVR